MVHLYYKVLIDGIEIAVFDPDSEPHLVKFNHVSLKRFTKSIEVIAGYYDDNNKWHNFEDNEEENNEEGNC